MASVCAVGGLPDCGDADSAKTGPRCLTKPQLWVPSLIQCWRQAHASELGEAHQQLAMQMVRCFGKVPGWHAMADCMHAKFAHTAARASHPPGTSCSFMQAVSAASQEVRSRCSHLAGCEHSPRCSQQLRVLDICAEDIATADAAEKCQEISSPSYAVRQSLQLTDKRAVKSMYPRPSSALPASDTTKYKAHKGSEVQSARQA